MTPISNRLHFPARIVAVLCILLCGGCLSSGPSAKEKQAAEARVESARAFKGTMAEKQHRVSIPELDQLTYGYADRYYMVISSAADAIKNGNPDPVQRRVAHQIKLSGVLAMNDIVSGNDPYAKTLDLVVSVTLQSIVWIDEDGAEKVFGDRAPDLIQAMRTMRIEAWELAAKVLTQEQLELLDFIILEWRRTHRDIDQVAYVKFDNFAGARAAGLLSDLKSGDGFLAPLSEASKVMADWARLTERAFWYSKRAPNIAAIQAEGAVNEILAASEISSMIQTAERLGKTAEAVPQTIKTERQALFADLDSHQALLTNMLNDVRKIVADVDSVGRSATLLTTNVQQTLVVLGETIKVAETAGRRFGLDQPSAGPPGRPFDIQEYAVALTRLNEAITNLHQLSLDADALTRSEGWKKALQDVTDATDHRMDLAFTRVCLALGLAFILAVAYRVISLRLARRMARTVQEES